MLQSLEVDFVDILRKFMRFVVDVLFNFLLDNLHPRLIFQNVVFEPQSSLVVRFHGFLEEVLLVVFIEVSACDFKLELPALSEEQLASFVEVGLEGLKLFDHVIGQA